MCFHNSSPRLINGCSNRTPVCSWHEKTEMQQGCVLRLLLRCADFSASLGLTTRPDAVVAALHLPACINLQVIGRVGFGKTFGCLESLDHPAEGDAFKMVAVGPLLTCEVAVRERNRCTLLFIS